MNNAEVSMLEFEHTIEVNCPGDCALPPISRSELWQGLVLRAREPQAFNPHLRCSTRATGINTFERTIEAGEDSFCEEVILYPERQIVTRTTARDNPFSAQSRTRIEHSEEGALFVLFFYQRDLSESDEKSDIGVYLQAAYRQLDEDAIRRIRQTTKEGVKGPGSADRPR
jgi:hypothetical protein